jgi:hypothetical protein
MKNIVFMRKVFYYMLGGALAFFMSGCQQGKNPLCEKTIDLDPFFKNKKEQHLSDIAAGVKLQMPLNAGKQTLNFEHANFEPPYKE